MNKPSLYLRLLGGFALDDPSGKAGPALPQRRSEATLAVLAVAGDMGSSRERLMAYLWPESPESKARHNLRDTLYAIRRTLGRDPLVRSGDALRLDTSVISSDVQAFAAALSDGRLAEAVALYRGPFLDGFHLGGTRDFDRWTEDERTRLAQDRQQAVKELAKTAERKERWDEAADWWGRAVAGDRFNSRLVVRRMVALTRAGDRANAVMEGEQHCRDLTTELGLDPDPALLEELARIRDGQVGPPQFFTPPPRPER
jgi:DNA-binding SARP family transcriptional activator